MVERLLQDDRVDPAADDNLAIRYTAREGHLAVVERLLQDDRVDPSVDDNRAIKWAAYHKSMAEKDYFQLARINDFVKTVVMLFVDLKRSHPETINALKENKNIKACFREKRDAYLLASSFFRQAPLGTERVVLATLERETALCKGDADKIRNGNRRPIIEVEEKTPSTYCVIS